MSNLMWLGDNEIYTAAIGSLGLWLTIALYLFGNRVFFDHRQNLLRRVVRAAEGRSDQESPDSERLIDDLLKRSSRRAVYRLAGQSELPASVRQQVAAFSVDKWGLDQMLRDASGGSRRKWRRISALFALGQMRIEGVHLLLKDALFDPDPEISGAAAVVLHRLGDLEAARILLDGLRARAYSPARIATHLEQFPTSIARLLLPLLDDPLPHVRFWSISLLFRYAQQEGTAEAVLAKAEDSEAQVRKAAMETLGASESPLGLKPAAGRLSDEVPYVRSAAIRAVARLAISTGDGDVKRWSASIIKLALGDTAYEVRLAAKESLVRLGREVWREVAEELQSRDAFARNGAAEVLQNMRWLDDVMEELDRGADPDSELIEVVAQALREGGDAMVDAAVARLGPELQLDVEQLLAELRIGT